MILRGFVLSLPLLLAAGCQSATTEAVVLRALPVDDLDGVLSQSSVVLDRTVTSDGKGALRIDASGPTVVRLYEVSDLTVENARLIYRARVKADDVQGQAFLEMWCVLPGKGEFFSRSLHSPISGSVDWCTLETPFFLEKGQRPERVKLNVVIDGSGTLWIDDIALVKGPLK